MARRRRAKLTVSLFPFLSVLACVIGTLTLMITALALGQMDNDTVASAEKFEKLARQLAEDRDLIERLKQELVRIENEASDTLKRLADARIEIERLRAEKELALRQADQEPPKPDVAVPVVDAERHRKRMDQLQAELSERKKLIEKLLAELKERKKPPEEARVTIQPSGSGVDLAPTFVECTDSGIVIHEGSPPRQVRTQDLPGDAGFLALLDRVADQPKATVIFLVRDNGLSTYAVASSVARSRYARNGKLPVIGHGKIDLSLFRR
jgi:hypothetical protein